MARRFLTLILVIAAAAAAFVLAPTGFASAQRVIYGPPPSLQQQQAPQPQGGFFGFLFGGPPQQPVAPPVAPRRQPQYRAPAPAAPPVAQKPVVAKDPGARKILVVGDFMGGVVAGGLDQAFAAEPKIRIIDRTNANSGLVRPDTYNWAASLPDILSAARPDIVVVMLGANDRQAVTGTGAATFGTPDWDGVYGDRVTALATALVAYGAPFFWVGTVPSRSTPEPDMAHLNDLSEPRVSMAGGTFVDVWDGFTDDNGHLIISGPDVDGQTRPLRTANGINFTDAGQAKLAFYVQQAIRRQTGIGTGAVDLLTSLSPASHVEVGADGRRRVVGPVVSLGDPPPAAGTALAGEAQPAAASLTSLLATPKDPQSPQALLIRGEALPAVAGRADNFAWPTAAAGGPDAGPVAAAR